MRRPRTRSHRSRPRIKLAADQIRVTNEEILGDLLYPAPPRSVNRVQRIKVGR
jgi:hypothetical protein